MFDHELFAASFARALHVLRAQPPVLDQQKASLRAVHTLTTVAPATLRVQGGVLSIDEVAIAPQTPHVADLAAQLAAHGVAEIAIARGAAPGDLLVLLRALAGAPVAGDTVQGRLREWGAASIAVVAAPGAPPPPDTGRRTRGSQVFRIEALDPGDAFASWTEAPADEAPQDGSWAGPGLREIDLGFTADDTLPDGTAGADDER